MRFASRYHRRTAFSLVELLVVISIIAVLSALSLSAVFSMRESQVKNATEATVQKLASAFDQQYKAVLDQIFEETPSALAMSLAGGDIRRGRVIHTKLRLRQEFPINFNQAANPIVFGSVGASLPPKPTYQQALIGVTSDPVWSSSAMLYMILAQGRRGMAAAAPDTLIDASAIQSQTVNNKTFQIFVDSWGNPLRFFLFPTNNDEINLEPYIKTVTTGPGPPQPYTLSRDVQDPEDTLMSTAWALALRDDFKRRIHDLPNAGVSVPARHLMPVVASSGKDGAFGLDDPPLPQFAQYMRITNPDAQQDNIYSYRLRRFGGRGD